MSTPIPAIPIFPQNRATTANLGPDLANDKALTNPQTELDAGAVNQCRAEIAAIEASSPSALIQVRWNGSAFSVLNVRAQGLTTGMVSIDATAPTSPIVTIDPSYGLVPVMASACVCTTSGGTDVAANVTRTLVNPTGVLPTSVKVYLSASASFMLTVST